MAMSEFTINRECRFQEEQEEEEEEWFALKALWRESSSRSSRRVFRDCARRVTDTHCDRAVLVVRMKCVRIESRKKMHSQLSYLYRNRIVREIVSAIRTKRQDINKCMVEEQRKVQTNEQTIKAKDKHNQ